jgi:hypothetical protein
MRFLSGARGKDTMMVAALFDGGRLGTSSFNGDLVMAAWPRSYGARRNKSARARSGQRGPNPAGFYHGEPHPVLKTRINPKR